MNNIGYVIIALMQTKNKTLFAQFANFKKESYKKMAD